jgi:hypothetical protein
MTEAGGQREAAFRDLAGERIAFLSSVKRKDPLTLRRIG